MWCRGKRGERIVDSDRQTYCCLSSTNSIACHCRRHLAPESDIDSEFGGEKSFPLSLKVSNKLVEIHELHCCLYANNHQHYDQPASLYPRKTRLKAATSRAELMQRLELSFPRIKRNLCELVFFPFYLCICFC